MGGERQVVVRGDTVVRPCAPWTATIHSLLSHLAAQGLPVPEPLELTPEYEVVRFLPGDTVADEQSNVMSLESVRSAGELLRAIHDGTRTWKPPADAVWAVPVEGGPVICHGDPKPGNMTWHQGHANGLFDWDDARPAERLSDVAYAVYWFTSPVGDDFHTRVEAFLDGYAWVGPFDPVRDVRERRLRAIDEVEYLGKRGYEPCATWLAQGWPARWRAEASTPEVDSHGQ